MTRNLTAVFTEDTVTYAPVEFTLPEAWANYTVTITNNGTVNANLADCKVVTSLDDGSDFADAFEVSVPEFGADEVLAPGESCTFNVVVKALNDADGNMAASTGSFSTKAANNPTGTTISHMTRSEPQPFLNQTERT